VSKQRFCSVVATGDRHLMCYATLRCWKKTQHGLDFKWCKHQETTIILVNQKLLSKNVVQLFLTILKLWSFFLKQNLHKIWTYPYFVRYLKQCVFKDVESASLRYSKNHCAVRVAQMFSNSQRYHIKAPSIDAICSRLSILHFNVITLKKSQTWPYNVAPW